MLQATLRPTRTSARRCLVAQTSAAKRCLQGSLRRRQSVRRRGPKSGFHVRLDSVSVSLSLAALPQVRRDGSELLEGSLKVVGYLLSYDVGVFEVCGVFEALVPDPG